MLHLNVHWLCRELLCVSYKILQDERLGISFFFLVISADKKKDRVDVVIFLLVPTKSWGGGRGGGGGREGDKKKEVKSLGPSRLLLTDR